MSWTSIPHAHEYWESKRLLAEPAADLEDVETFILGSHPVTAQDAACMLDVACAYDGDRRCDGLDRMALTRINAFLRALP